MEFEWGHNKRYNDFSSWFKKTFNQRVQKVAINAGFTCPNRDGEKSKGGCTYCNNITFNPFYCTPEKSVSKQIEEGINFFFKKYKSQKYLAYFQAYSNTYASLDVLKSVYTEALQNKKVIGLVIATRPDCVNKEVLDYLEELAKKYYIVIEYGIESCNNKALEFINRGHTWEDSYNAIMMTANRGIHIGAHLIMGIPGDDKEQMIKNAVILSDMPVETLKLHQLQIVENTIMSNQYKENKTLFNLFSANDYIEFVVDIIERINPKIILERFINQSPGDMLIAPKWDGLKNFEFVAKVEKRLNERGTWQGKLYEK